MQRHVHDMRLMAILFRVGKEGSGRRTSALAVTAWRCQYKTILESRRLTIIAITCRAFLWL